VELRLPASDWVFHKNSGDAQTLAVDVAVMKIGGIKDRSITAFRFCPQNCPKEEYKSACG